MRDTKITIEHNGRTYNGAVMRITRTHLGDEDHGIVTAYLHCEGNSGGISVGGYTLDTPVKEAGKFVGRIGTAYGLDHLMRLMETVGVDRWEKLPGQSVIVLYEGSAGWGGTSVGIAGLLNDKVLILKEHVAEFEARYPKSDPS